MTSDVFISYNSEDKAAAETIAQRLQDQDLRPFLDTWHLTPGKPWQQELESALERSSSCAILIGGRGLGPWVEAEMRVAIDRQQANPDFRVIPVLLPGAQKPSRLPGFLRQRTWVDFEGSLDNADAFHRLIAGIRGVAPGSGATASGRATRKSRDRRLFAAIEDAKKRKEELISAGHDTAGVQEEILDLRRRLREGGRLRAGDSLAEDRFGLREVIGQGGFATVWKAYDRQEETLVAVKVLHGQFSHDRTRRERLFRGARKMAGLQHQGIVRVIETQLEDAGFHFFVMEFVEGGDLQRVVGSQVLAPATSVQIVARVRDFVAALEVSPPVQRVLLRSISLQAKERPASASDLGRELESALNAGVGEESAELANGTGDRAGVRYIDSTTRMPGPMPRQEDVSDVSARPRWLRLSPPTIQNVAIELPRDFERLYDLAYNLWWSWTPQARELFSTIDSAKWALYREPVQLLINVDPGRWLPLLDNEAFWARYQAVLNEFDDYLLAPHETWFSRHFKDARGETIAYFSMEYGLHQSLAIYSGGLGVLSGDHCKAASDLGVPLVAVGLLYRNGYFQQNIDADGRQQHTYPELDFNRLPVRPIASPTGKETTITVRLPGRGVKAKLWLAQVGRVPLILLDTDLPENDPADRPISSQLYVSGRELRLLQETLLGIGGVKALRAVGIEPGVWHLNEAHSVFLQLERLREMVQGDGLDLETARQRIRANALFTTHTPVAAGNERFDRSLIDKYFRAWCGETGLPLADLLELGRAHDGDSDFNLTALAIRITSWTNSVSRLNAEVTSRMWEHLFPDREAGQPPIHAVTNGVHAGTWLGQECQELLRLHLSSNWRTMLLSEDGWDKVLAIPDGDLWTTHRVQKERLGRFTRSRLREQAARHGAPPDELRAIGALFDPRALTIGFAHRFATYKRAKLIFTDEARLRSLLADEDRPVQVIFAGKAHPADRPGQQLIQHIFELSRSDGFAGKVFFLENYDIRMGRMLVQGVDLWLNTPRRPLEASGTSGQKVAMNGGLNFSVADGWWPEGWNGDNGWVIGSEETPDDEASQDDEDVRSLYETLESVIVPLFYERDQRDLPRRWIAMMKASMASLTPRFSASRMVRDYAENAYLPAAARGQFEPSKMKLPPGVAQ